MEDFDTTTPHLRNPISSKLVVNVNSTIDSDTDLVEDSIPEDDALVHSSIGLREAENYVFEKARDLHPLFPHQPTRMKDRAQSRAPMSYEAQRVELIRNRSAKLKRSDP